MRHLQGHPGPVTRSACVVKDSPWLSRHLQESLISVLLKLLRCFAAGATLACPPPPANLHGVRGDIMSPLSDSQVQRLHLSNCPRPHKSEMAGLGLGTWSSTFKASTALRANPQPPPEPRCKQWAQGRRAPAVDDENSDRVSEEAQTRARAWAPPHRCAWRGRGQGSEGNVTGTPGSPVFPLHRW